MLITRIIKTIRGLLGQEKPEKPVACGHGPEPTANCPECGAERRRATKYRWTVFSGLLLPCAIQSLDTTMCAVQTPGRGRTELTWEFRIATALPTIAIEFGK